MKIVFMGTPDFAVTILDGIVKSGHDIVGVITAPDKPAGRGRKITESAVKNYSLKANLKILQPTNLKEIQFQEELSSLDAELFVVVAFRMLPESVWAMPPKGTINLHASLLPQYRGAAPINWAIINGEKETGVTTFFIEKEIDTGKIIEAAPMKISENMTAGELHDELALLGCTTMIETLKKIESGTFLAKEQANYNIEDQRSAPKIFKDDCKIDWSKSLAEIHNFIRGLCPYPAAWTILKGKDKDFSCKLFNSERTDLKVIDQSHILTDELGFLFPCSDFYIRIREIQLEGKRRMTMKEFCAGNNIESFSINI